MACFEAWRWRARVRSQVRSGLSQADCCRLWGYPAARVRGVAAALLDAGGSVAAAAADHAEARLKCLPSQWFLAVEPIDLRCRMDRLLV